MKAVLYISYICMLFALSFCQKEDQQAQDSVVQLTMETFDAAIAKQHVSICEFYTTWCGYCQQFASQYTQAANDLKPHGLSLFKVECQSQGELCNRYKVTGYPTLKVFIDGVPYKDYENRSGPLIVTFMIRMNKLQAQIINTIADLTSFRNTTDFSVLGIFDEKDSEQKSLFDKCASEHREIAEFATSSSAEVRNALKVSHGPAIIAFTSENNSGIIFQNTFTPKDIGDFLLTERLPLVGHINVESYGRYLETKLRIVFIFYLTESQEEIQALIEKFSSSARKFRTNFVFGLIDAFEHKSLARSFGLTEDNHLSIAVNDPYKNLKYPMLPQTDVLTVEDLEEFLNGILSGAVQPTFNSAPVPENNNGPVKVVVHNTFNQMIVEDKERDVIVEFYAPWCQACKRLGPMLEKIALIYAELKDKVVFCNFDIDSNDIPIDAKVPQFDTIPRIFLYPAHNKEPIEYAMNNFDVDSFTAFIETNSYHHVKPPTPIQLEDMKHDEGTEHEEHSEGTQDREDL